MIFNSTLAFMSAILTIHQNDKTPYFLKREIYYYYTINLSVDWYLLTYQPYVRKFRFLIQNHYNYCFCKKRTETSLSMCTCLSSVTYLFILVFFVCLAIKNHMTFINIIVGLTSWHVFLTYVKIIIMLGNLMFLKNNTC